MKITFFQMGKWKNDDSIVIIIHILEWNIMLIHYSIVIIMLNIMLNM